MAAPRSAPTLTPLIAWAERQEIAALEARRTAIVTKMARLPLRAHRRLELRGELRALTEQILQAEAEINRDTSK